MVVESVALGPSEGLSKVKGVLMLLSEVMNPNSISPSCFLQSDIGLVFGGLIRRDRSGCEGKISIS